MKKDSLFLISAVVASLVMGAQVSWAGLPTDVTRALDDYEQGQDDARRAMSVPVAKSVAVRPVSNPDERRRHETEIGFETYAYKYEETVEGEHFMDLKGRFYGIFVNHTFRPNPLDPLWGDLLNTIRFEGRYAWAGDLDYNGGVSDGAGFEAPLTMSNVKDFVWEARVLAGQEIRRGVFSFMPYFGFGMRFLHDDSTDTSGTFDYLGTTYSTNGYKRTSEYYYLPAGINVGALLGGGWSLALNGEFDIFLYGHQKSCLDSTTGPVPKNQQNEGYGLRGSLRIEKTPAPIGFSFEPYIRYWDIEDSDPSYIPGYVLTEPSNVTREIGVKMGMIF